MASDKDGHCGNALRHDDDHAIAGGHTVVAKYFGLKASAAAELGKGHGLAFVFVDPGGNKWAICGSCLERLNEIAKSVHAAAIVSGWRMKSFQLR